MDRGWRFHKGDVVDDIEHGYLYTYMHTKTERGRGPAAMDYDDSAWKQIDLPHDYVVEGKPTSEANPVHGSLKRENAWYRKFFRIEKDKENQSIHILFEGICTQSKIWVNGCYMGMNDSAYTEINLDITDIARYGDDLNELSVYVDNTEYEGWWYEGGGIYRHVWLVMTESIAVEEYGVFVHPQFVQDGEWEVPIETTVQNDSFEEGEIKVFSKVLDSHGNLVMEEVDVCTVPARKKKEISQIGTVRNPMLWSLKTPNLYKLKTQIWQETKLLDEVETVFGFRSIVFNPDRGFILNGVETKIKGMCIHEDHGGLGVALPDNVKEYRVQRLKDMGCNGYRFSHNPHSRETLDACDKLGMLVMDENRWFESSENGLRRLENLVKRDRNHPSVIIWSVGNEESLQSGRRGQRIMGSMKEMVHRLDGTRPVLMAMHTGLLEDGAAVTSDMIGMNYNIELCEEVHKKHPDKAIIFSEVNNASEEDVLGDRNCGIRTWEIVDTKPYMSGMFAWTGMDYRGEHDYPGLFAPCGCMDQNGYPKDSYHLYKTYWGEEPYIYIQPHWNHKKEGEPVLVRVFATGDEVSLYLNGKEIGCQKNDPYFQTDWEVCYEPGTLKAVTRKNGIVIAETKRQTTKDPYRLVLTLENPQVKSRCKEAAIYTVSVEDRNGNRIPDAETCFQIIRCKGLKFIVAGNGDVKDQADRRETNGRCYEGKAQILLEVLEEETELAIEAEGLITAVSRNHFKAGDRIPEVETCQGRYVTKWEMADLSKQKPMLKDGNYSWITSYKTVEIGHGTQLQDLLNNSGFLNYHSSVEIPKDRKQEELSLVFELLEGKAEVIVELKNEEGGLVKRIQEDKDYEEPDDLKILLPGYEDAKQVDIWVCLEIFSPFHGITKPVRWEFEARKRG